MQTTEDSMKTFFMAALLFSFNAYSADFCKDLKLTSCLTAQKIGDQLQIDPVYFSSGSFSGQMVDQTIKRPVQFIPELETDSSYFVSQFYNQKQFWIAEIPKDNIDTVIFQLALFKGPVDYTLAHGQYRFIGHKPIKLYRLKHGHITTTETKDFIFTIQAALPNGEIYNAKDAFMGNYKVVARLSNTFDRAMNEEVLDGDIVTQYVLKKLDQKKRDLLLKNAIQYSSENLLNKDYSGISENCLSIAFDILDKTLNLDMGRVTLTVGNLLFNGKSPNEKMALDALKERGLINETSRIENYKR
jgi:hypothetical protein